RGDGGGRLLPGPDLGRLSRPPPVVPRGDTAPLRDGEDRRGRGGTGPGGGDRPRVRRTDRTRVGLHRSRRARDQSARDRPPAPCRPEPRRVPARGHCRRGRALRGRGQTGPIAPRTALRCVGARRGPERPVGFRPPTAGHGSLQGGPLGVRLRASWSRSGAALSRSPLPTSTYERAERLLGHNRSRLALRARVAPRWIGDGASFWYSVETERGTEFVLAAPERGERRPAFDQERLAEALTKAAGTPASPFELPLSALELDEDEVRFEAFGDAWACRLDDYACRCLGAAGPRAILETPSPDGRWVAFRRDE